MSIPACIWASQKGREFRLSCPERVMLWQLAERANCKGFCWPSVIQLMDDTGLARQTVLTVVQGLAKLGLIRIEKQGQRHVYYVLRPVQNKTGERSKTRPDTGLKSDQPTGLKTTSNRSKIATGTGLKSLPEPLKEPEKEPAAREGTRLAAANGREPEKQNLNSEQKAVAPPPSPLPKAPVLGATNGSVPPNAMRPFADGAAEPPPTEAEREQMAQQFEQLAADLERRVHHFAIPRGPRFTANEHRDIAAKMTHATELPGVKPDVLAAIYRSQGIVRGVRANA